MDAELGQNYRRILQYALKGFRYDIIIEQNYPTFSTTENSSLPLSIDARRAKSIARKFLEQSHSLLIFKEAILEGDTWTVIMDVGHTDEHIVRIKVDSKTGRIVACS